MRTIHVALPEHLQTLVDELVDNQAAQVWLQQEGAFHLGVAIGLRLAKLPAPEPAPTTMMTTMTTSCRRRPGRSG